MKPLILILIAGLAVGSSVGQAAESPQVTIEHVQVRATEHGHVVLLKAEGKVIPVFVDPTVALSIHGALSVATKDATKVFDSRSSDAIALAIHFKAPILVGRDLLDSAGMSLKEEGGAETL